MDSNVNLCRSLPPLVEGKVHGYLKLSIDEIIWTNSIPKDVTILAYWWGELDSAEFRPADILAGVRRTERETSEIYIIRTNISLFKEYVRNCQSVKFVITEYDTRKVLGTGQISQLSDIFGTKAFFRYVPIYDKGESEIGELHVSIKLINATKSLMVHIKSENKLRKYCVNNDVSMDGKAKFAYDKGKLSNIAQHAESNMSDMNKIVKSHEDDIYNSILKVKRMECGNPKQKVSTEIKDKLVAEIVTRAQRLRGAILKETYNEESTMFSDNSIDDSMHCNKALGNGAKLYEYILGKEISISDERKVLKTLKSISPTRSLIDFTSDTLMCHKRNNIGFMSNQAPFTETNCVDENLPKSISLNDWKASPLTYVDNIKIRIETFSLSPAGRRRVRSCSACIDGIQRVTFLVQYDPTFGNIEQKYGKLSDKHDKPVRISSKKQIGEGKYSVQKIFNDKNVLLDKFSYFTVINFNHEGVHDLSHINLDLNLPLYFKILIRHTNQKSPTELGIGCIYVKDIANSEDLRIARVLAITNKGMKVGELKVSIGLVCDHVDLRKKYVDAIMSTKENIPVMGIQSLSSIENEKFRSMTGTQSKTNSKISPVQSKATERLSANNNNTDLIITRDITRYDNRDMDDRKVDVQNRDIDSGKKILLHGLIDIAEGKDLSELNTYLICRAFWKEDRATSKLCMNTKHPLYQFSQLIPLIHGTDLLERIRDNYIIIEVYSKNNTGTDELLGIAKLPLHQLYIAYRDPLVLPYLLKSRYPTISVDEWVPIYNPVNGQLSGQLLALVALGTAEQIAFLKMSRGLTNNSSEIIYVDTSNNSNHAGSSKHNFDGEIQRGGEGGGMAVGVGDTSGSRKHTDVFHLNGNHVNRNLKSQGIQTDITGFEEPTRMTNSLPSNLRTEEDPSNPKCFILHSLVDRLAHALTVTKSNVNGQTAQTEICEMPKIQSMDADSHSCFNPSNTSVRSDESDSATRANNFHLPIESYRSVGVGAEFDEEADRRQPNNHENAWFDSTSDRQNVEKEETHLFFRAVLDIECALHLPKVERNNGAIEPSTYVTFQKNRSDSRNHSYATTNVSFHSCNPRWNWRCDAKFPMELLTNDDKRLILKIWRLADPNMSLQSNPEKDTVIGFSAIDLSVLLAGFPTVSGWFHIMDFTGRCNGQIKVSITPLENVSSLGKSASAINATQAPLCNFPQSSCTRSHFSQIQNSVPLVPCAPQPSENTLGQSNSHNLDDTSMSFLSLSLKQKLTELDDITKRLQTRLRDVTNNAFEEDFVNEFDLNEPNSDSETNDNGNANDKTDASRSEMIVRGGDSETIWEAISFSSDRNNRNNRANAEMRTLRCLLVNDETRGINCEPLDSGYCTGSNYRSSQNPTASDNHTQCQNEYSSQADNSSENSLDYPARGTKMHINHLLDKLSLHLPSTSSQSRHLPVTGVNKLLTNMEHSSKNPERKKDFVLDAIAPSRPAQAIAENTQSTQTPQSFVSLNDQDSKDERKPESQPSHKMSSVIREELIAEENNDSGKCDDELTSYLITSNVRHMSIDNIFNPLLYQHLASDLHLSNVVSPDGEAIDQLDNRYVRTFKSTLNDGLSRLESLIDAASVSTVNGNACSVSNIEETAKPFRVTLAGVSSNLEGKIVLTPGTLNSNDNDLIVSTDSTTTISFDKYSEKQTDADMDGNSYSMLSDGSVSGVSRQAPDGGNPMEDTIKPVTAIQHMDPLDHSLSS